MDSKAAIFIWFQGIGDGMFTFLLWTEIEGPCLKGFVFVRRKHVAKNSCTSVIFHPI